MLYFYILIKHSRAIKKTHNNVSAGEINVHVWQAKEFITMLHIVIMTFYVHIIKLT